MPPKSTKAPAKAPKAPKAPTKKAPAKKKTFKKPGQKKVTPPKTDSLRIFYSSLFKQNPKSDMAFTWLLERGVFSEKKATDLLMSRGLEKLLV